MEYPRKPSNKLENLFVWKEEKEKAKEKQWEGENV